MTRKRLFSRRRAAAMLWFVAGVNGLAFAAAGNPANAITYLCCGIHGFVVWHYMKDVWL